MMKKVNLHLISDSTGETVSSVARAVFSLFDGIEAEENIWSLVRTKGQIDKVIEEVKKEPGIVLHTVIDPDLQEYLLQKCRKINTPAVAPLNRVISEISALLGRSPEARPGSQHELDDHYFSRVDAINFSLSHDDGQATWDLDEADIILIGVSRTSKSPTCVYLAYRGYKTANIPLVREDLLPESLFKIADKNNANDKSKEPLVVGLTISPDRLIEIRKSRLMSLKEERNTEYVDTEAVREEVKQAKKLFLKNKWPIIDVTRRSVEEIAANIIQLYQDRKKRG